MPTGTLGMIAKTKKDIRQQSRLESAQKTPKKHDVRRCITARAMLRDDICTMKLHVYMLHNNEWYLHSQSCLNHCNHPPLPPKAKAKSSMDMSPGSKTLVSTTNGKVLISIYSICLTFFRVIISLQLSTLYRHNVPPSAISEVFKEFKGDDDGTYLPKTLFNANERYLDLLNLAEGILKDDSDAEKLIKVLDA